MKDRCIAAINVILLKNDLETLPADFECEGKEAALQGVIALLDQETLLTRYMRRFKEVLMTLMLKQKNWGVCQ